MLWMPQLSVGWAAKATLAVDLPASVGTIMGAGQLGMGGSASITVSMVMELLLLPAASVAVTFTEVTPTGTKVPAAGDCVSTIRFAGLQLSDTVTLGKRLGTSAWQCALAGIVSDAGLRTVGGTVSVTFPLTRTVTLKVVVETFPAVSVEVQCTVEVPRPKGEPDGGLQTTA